jgi:hypothetical protein
MEFEFTWIEENLVVCRTSGPASADGFAALFAELVAQPQFGPGIGVLSDHTDLEPSTLTAADIERIAEIRESNIGAGGMRSAVVVGQHSPVRYGLARMFESYVASHGDESVRVFETCEEAMAWLKAPDSPFPSEDAQVSVDLAP